MTGHQKSRIFLGASSVILMVAISVKNFEPQNISDIPMNIPSSPIAKIFEKTRLICFGRFVMKVPEASNIVYGPVEVDGALDFYPGKAKEIQKLISDQLVEVAKEKSYIPDYEIESMPQIGKVIDGIIPGQKILYGVSSGGYSIHSYIPFGEDLFVHYSRSVPPEEDALPMINKIATRLRLRSEQEIPVDPGTCIEGGFLSMQTEYENIAIGLNFREFPDVRFSIDIRKNQNYLNERDSPRELREQARESAERIGLGSIFARIKTLREGAKQFGVWDGEEILSRRPAYKDETDAHEFRFFSMGSKNDTFHPSVDIRLDTGAQGNAKASVKPGLTDEDAVALWDRLLSTIRLRHPADATADKVVSSKMPLGSIGRSRDVCPQTGWWECLDKKKIDGDRRRLFVAGKKIPPVIITRHINLWRTLIGDVHDLADVEWTLVAYEDLSSPDEDDLNAAQVQSDNAKDRHV